MGGKALVQHQVCIDLPGEPVKCAAETELTVLLRKHRDVVFDIKLQAGATYTITTTHPDQPNGRFYDTKRKANVGKTTFKDGEPCHIWLGRTFEGSLILTQGEKVLGRYAISKLDCTKGCSDDAKDKPAPMLIIMHDDQSLAKELSTVGSVTQDTKHSATTTPPSSRGAAGLDDSRARSLNPAQFASAPIPFSEVQATRSRDVLPMVHAFKIKQTSGSMVPPELVAFFASGADSFKWDPLNTLSKNFLTAQLAGGLAYGWDTFGPNGPLKGFWNRVFIIVRNSNGEFTMFFQTSRKERDLLGFLLTTYRARSKDVQVMTLLGGTGSLSSGTRATWEAANAAINPKTMTGRAMGFAIAMDTMAWMQDYETIDKNGKRKQDFANLLATISLDVAQMWLATVAATATISLVFASGAMVAGAAITAPVWMIALGAVLITWTFSYIVAVPFNQKDEKDQKIGDHFANAIRRAGSFLEQQLAKDYPATYSESKWEVFPMGAIP
ncbi:hypothetical protein [Burkholderia territorii]|uniref:hypothetical protein n=1 Tax=Burkholderia territorii TaxID=1503055 RepID=UPI00075C2A72|nr:hypothetical protein [Burkholderia territorii]KWA13990.1 hypothetical protein WT38_03030 [Burkholderia territorii]